MNANPIHYICYVDLTDRNQRRRMREFREEMERLHTCKITEVDFDASLIQWTERRERMYASDEYVMGMAKKVKEEYGTDADAILFFVGDKHWQQGKYRLRGFKLGRVFDTYYVGFARLRYAKDTGEHEVLHLVDEFIKANTGISLDAVFGVKDFDEDIVHSQQYWKDEDYKYDVVWAKISDHVSNAVFQRRQATLTNKIALLRQLVKLYLQLLNLKKYESHSIYDIDIKEMHTTKRYEAPLRAENAVIGHIDLGTENGTIDTILNGTRSASYHWYIPRHGKYVIEFVPKEYAAWHAGRLSNPEAGLDKILGGPNEQIESGEPNWYAYGICYEGIDTGTEPNEAQLDLAAHLMRLKKIHELPLIGHYQVTDYKPRIVKQFVDGVSSILNK